MPAITELKEDLDDIVTMKFISQAFTEASAAKLQKIRGSFERNKKFYEEISHVYHLVRISGAQLKLGADGKKVQPKKILAVAVTSNQRFYGNINILIMRSFLQEAELTKADLFVLGSTGMDFIHQTGKEYPGVNMVFKKDFPSQDETDLFLDKINLYDTVYLYYPRFISLLTQTVGKIDITQMASPLDPTPEEEIHILFEPDFTKILEFFQHQVRHLLFMRIMLEADLARTAARLLTMSAAEERSDDLIRERKSILRKAITSLVNRQLLETFSGIKLWKK